MHLGKNPDELKGHRAGAASAQAGNVVTESVVKAALAVFQKGVQHADTLKDGKAPRAQPSLVFLGSSSSSNSNSSKVSPINLRHSGSDSLTPM